MDKVVVFYKTAIVLQKFMLSHHFHAAAEWRLVMKKDSRTDSMNEMEQIQRGLEAFLEQELEEMQAEKSGSKPYQAQDMETDQEMQDQTKTESAQAGDEAFYDFTIDDERDMDDEEDMTDMEDWDNPEYRRRVKESRQQRAGAGGNNRSNKNSRKSGGASTQRKKAAQRAGNVRDAGAVRRGGGMYEEEARASGNRKAQSESSRGKKKRKRKSGLKRFLIIVLVLLAVLAGGMYLAVGSVYDQMHYEPVDSVTAESMQEDGVINVLLIGNDSRENGEDGRSDAMILLSISSKTKTIYMTSLLRDMYVEIPGYKNNRLNAAYSFGGAELLMETIEQNFDITVNRYMLVNFEAFANLVDAVGGVDLELTSQEIEYVNGYLVEYNILLNRPEGTDYMDTSVSGLVHLNGPQALAYSRNRYIGTDFGRTERQRKVLEAIIKKLPQTLVTNPGELFEGLMTNLTTNLTKEECYLLSLRAATFLGYDLVQSSIPLEGTYKNATIRDMAVLEVDFEANKQYLQQYIYGNGQQEQEPDAAEE